MEIWHTSATNKVCSYATAEALGGSVFHAGQTGELTNENTDAGGGVGSVSGDTGRTGRAVSAGEALRSARHTPRLGEVESTSAASALRDV